MLRFNQAQEAFVLSNRRAFNAHQTAMANQFDGAMGLIGNAETLPREVWGEWDRDAITIQRETLVIFNDLASSVSTPMDIGKLIHHFQTVSDSGNVNVSLDGRSKARPDRPVFAYHGTPLPIVDSTFSFGWRQMKAAATEGFNLDGTARLNSNQRIAETMEDMVLNGESTISVNGTSLYGLRNHPKRKTRTTGVALASATAAQWVAEMQATVKMLHDANFRVPATIYVNWADWRYAMTTDYTNGTGYTGKTIAQRVMEDPMIKEVIPADRVPANEIIAVIKDRRNLQILNGMPMATRAQFRANPEDEYNFVTMMAAALEIKFDAEDNTGLAHSAP